MKRKPPPPAIKKKRVEIGSSKTKKRNKRKAKKKTLSETSKQKPIKSFEMESIFWTDTLPETGWNTLAGETKKKGENESNGNTFHSSSFELQWNENVPLFTTFDRSFLQIKQCNKIQLG